MSAGDVAMSAADRAIEASLKRLQEDNDNYLRTPSPGNDAALVSSMGSYAGALRTAGQNEKAREIERTGHKFKIARSSKKKNMSQALSKKLVGAAAVFAADGVGEAIVEVGAEAAAEGVLEMIVPGMSIFTLWRVGKRMWRGERRPWDRRRFCLAAGRVILTGGA